MAASEATIREVLSEFRRVTDALIGSTDLLRVESVGIKAEVREALVQLQFQDRVSQVMCHVKNNIERLPEALEQHRRQSEHEGALQPLDAGPLLAELEKTYAMADEFEVHRGKVALPREPEVTFF
jgi:methyl-accepting chemotaxis protein